MGKVNISIAQKPITLDIVNPWDIPFVSFLEDWRFIKFTGMIPLSYLQIMNKNRLQKTEKC